jgi:hypothetical protein
LAANKKSFSDLVSNFQHFLAIFFATKRKEKGKKCKQGQLTREF